MKQLNTKRSINSVACIGEVMIELSTDNQSQTQLGVAGDTYNTAVYLANAVADHACSVSYITALGDDPYSIRIRNAIQSYGIDDRHIAIQKGKRPGLYAIDTDRHGERSFSYWRNDSAAKTLFGERSEIRLDIIDSFDMIVLTGITLAILPNEVRLALIDRLKEFSNRGGTVVYDSNHRPELWQDGKAKEVNQAIWEICDIALPSIDDELLIFGESEQSEIEQRFLSYKPEIAVLKRGANGPFDLVDSQDYNLPVVTNVVDSTAAGDSFNAGFLGSLIIYKDLDKAIKAAHELSSKVIQFRGAVVPL